jgi:defect-in-organelle-trafficking protein DotA
MLFTFGVIGWLSFVIEAMVAAPIVAFAITYPEGGGSHELLGRAEKALELMLAIFIRPSAMIFGLIAALIMSYVAIDVLNIGFGTVIKSAFFQTSTGEMGVDTSALGQVKMGAMILVYTLIVMAILNQCFSLIVVLPGKIMRWIGISAEGGEEERRMAEAVKSGLGEAAGAGARAGGEAISGYKPPLDMKPTPTPTKKKEDSSLSGKADTQVDIKKG